RRAAARGGGARGGAAARSAAGRRAHGKSRLRHRGAHHRADRGVEPVAGQHARAGHARRGPGRPCRPSRHAAGRPHRLRRVRGMWALRHGARELRGAGRHFAYLAACVSLGVAALVAVGSLGRSVERTVAASGKTMMGGDVELRSSQPLSAASESAIADIAGRGAGITRIRELAAMAQPDKGGGERTLRVELKAAAPAYPLYGRLETLPPASLPDLIGGGRALVQEAVLSRLGLVVGDTLRIGEARFRVAGTIASEPD